MRPGPVLTALLLAGTAALAAPLTLREGDGYTGVMDQHLDDGFQRPWDPDANYDGQGLRLDSDHALTAALMRWDVGAIPALASVTRVELVASVYVESWTAHALREVLTPWTESEATWSSPAAGQTWASGAFSSDDYGGAELGTMGAGSTYVVELNTAGRAAVQAWISGDRPNQGLVVIGQLSEDMYWRDSEWPVASERPAMRVSYQLNGTAYVATLQQGIGGYTGASDTVIATAAMAPDTWSHDERVLRAGLSVSGARQAAVLRWELTPQLLPARAVVRSAALWLNVVRSSSTAGELRPLLRPWDEVASWRYARTAEPWEEPGARGSADRGPPLGAIPAFTSGGAYPLTTEGVAVVDGWLTNPNTNHGLLVVAEDATNQLVFFSSEVDWVSERPALLLDYELAPLSAAAQLLPGEGGSRIGAQVTVQVSLQNELTSDFQGGRVRCVARGLHVDGEGQTPLGPVGALQPAQVELLATVTGAVGETGGATCWAEELSGLRASNPADASLTVEALSLRSGCGCQGAAGGSLAAWAVLAACLALARTSRRDVGT